MRFLVTTAVLLAVVSMALVAVCQHSETRRLQHRVWQLEKRKERLERAQRRLAAALAGQRTPRRLLSTNDLVTEGDEVPAMPVLPREGAYEGERFEDLLPPGFVLGDDFEGGGR